MYTDHYNFRALPFQLTPDGEFFFGSEVHSRAMGFLDYGILHGEGYVVITGEVGAGKTTLVEHLLSKLDKNRFLVGRIVTTQLDGDNLLRMVAGAFNVYQIGLDKASILHKIKELLSALGRSGKRALLVVDEAQSLSKEALEELRMLSNIVPDRGVPLQGILLGQPEFRAIMTSPELEQLRQRVIASCHLGALDADDTQKYIEHRLAHVGWDQLNPHFSSGAYAEIYRYTLGIPRKINVLVSRLLLLGFLDNQQNFTAAMVGQVAREIASEIGPLHANTTQGSPFSSDGVGLQREELERTEQRLIDKIDALGARLNEFERKLQGKPSISEVPQPISKFR